MEINQIKNGVMASKDLGSFYRVVNGVVEWQPMVQLRNTPNADDWGVVEEDLIGDELVQWEGASLTLSTVYKIVRDRFDNDASKLQ